MKDRTWQVGLRLVPIVNRPSFTSHPPLVLPSPPLWLWLSYRSVLLGLAFCSLCCSCTRFLYEFPTRLAFENPAHLLNRICVNSVARFRDRLLQLPVLTCGWGSAKPVTVADGDRLLQGLQCAGVLLREKGLNLFWFHMTFLFVLPHFFLWFWLVCLFVWASLVLPSSQTLLISVSCRLGANRSSPPAPKISPAVWLLLRSVQALVAALTTGPRAQRCSEFTWGAGTAPSHLSPVAWADSTLQTGMRVPTREHLLPAWALLRVAGARWADAYGTHRGDLPLPSQAHWLLATLLIPRGSLA